MLAQNGAATTQSAPVANPLMAQRSAGTLECLSEIARRHQVCYEVCPEWSTKDGKKIQIGFELELCGISGNDTCLHPVPGCAHCVRAYNEIREIGEWILPREERPSRYEIQAFDRSLHVAPSKRQHRNEVIVRIVIMHRSDFNRPVDDCENRCLREMRDRLSELGIDKETWRAEGTNGPTVAATELQRQNARA
jgi:hypothetical protein